jgi:Fe-S oxidoreductase
MGIAILLVLILGSIVGFFIPVFKRLRIVAQAPGKFSWDNLGMRFQRLFFEVLLQSKVIINRPLSGLLHAFVFWGFLAFIIASINHFAHGFGGDLLGQGKVYKFITGFVTAFALLVIVGITGLAFRRFILKPKALGEHLSFTSAIVASFIEILMFTYLFGVFLFSEGTTTHNVNWWLHTVVILAFLVVIPQSKHLHLVFSPFTVFLKDIELARIRPLDIEKEEMGAEKLSHLEKHTALGAFTCVECGRCFDHCPARNTGKKLDPKQWMLDIRKGLLQNPAMEDPGEVLKFDMIWQCTTCGACTYQCPVGIDQVIPIIAFRRGFVSNGEFPIPMRALFDNLERSGNPWKYQPNEAEKFIQENNIPWYYEQDVLYWMGCMGRYDPQYQKVAKVFADLLQKAGINFGVLRQEKCTGDAARRAGNEFLFLSLAQENIAILNEIKAKKIITTCPHCLRTLSEYHDLGLRKNLQILHHSSFILELMEQGKLKFSMENKSKVVYHDACYLSRYEAPCGYIEPRRMLKSAGVNLLEVKRNRDISFCCGAGGGMLFSEETEGKRINHERIEELTASGANVIATSCPFCQIMLRDGLADKGLEKVEIRDIVQFI